MESSGSVVWKRLAVPLVVIGLTALMALLAGSLSSIPSVGTAIGELRSGGGEWWAVPLFVGLYALCALLLLPMGALSAAAALMWGWKVGGSIELLTCTLSSLVPWLLGRRGLARWAGRWTDGSSIRFDVPFAFTLLRIVPLIPFSAVNYLAGAAGIPLRLYLVATFFGSIPSVFLFAWFVDTMGGAALGAVTQTKVVAACFAVALAAVMGRLAAPRLKARLFAERTTPPPAAGDRRS